MRTISLALLGAVVLVAAGGALAQRPPEHASVVAAAVTDLVQLLRANDGVPEGTIRYDPRVLERHERDLPSYSAPVTTYELAGRQSQVASAAQVLMGAEFGDIDSARVCSTDSPRSCTLGDAVAVFATSDPFFQGDSADVVVKALWFSDLKKQPVQEGIFLVTLRREPDGWRAVARRTLVIT
jgi:hypothetical protein